MKKLAIFDLDGTILNTLEDLADSTNYALRHHGYHEHTIDEVRCMVGNGIAKLIERAVPEGTEKCATEAVLDTFREYYGKHCEDKTAPYQGIDELLNGLKNAGIMTAVLSNKADFAVQKLCERYFKDSFDMVAGEREKDGIKKKPAPDGVNIILEKLDIKPDEAVYIGDSDVDILTAKNSCMDGIYADWGFRGRAFLIEHGAEPDEIVDEPLKIITKMLDM